MIFYNASSESKRGSLIGSCDFFIALMFLIYGITKKPLENRGIYDAQRMLLIDEFNCLSPEDRDELIRYARSLRFKSKI